MASAVSIALTNYEPPGGFFAFFAPSCIHMAPARHPKRVFQGVQPMSLGIVFWLVIATIVVVAIYFRHRDTESRNQVLQAMIEKGQPLPPDLFQKMRNPMDGNRLIVGGIILIALGFAALIFFGAMRFYGEFDEEAFVPFVSAFPFCLGIGCLVAAYILKRHG